MATTKSRREIFEEQLRDLQKDISNLSSKLSIPPTVSSTRVGTTTFSADSRIDSSSISIAKVCQFIFFSIKPTRFSFICIKRMVSLEGSFIELFVGRGSEQSSPRI
jgi:hypothetical protein